MTGERLAMHRREHCLGQFQLTGGAEANCTQQGLGVVREPGQGMLPDEDAYRRPRAPDQERQQHEDARRQAELEAPLQRAHRSAPGKT